MPVASAPAVEPFVTAVGQAFASTSSLSCPPLNIFIGGGTPPWTLFTVNASLVTTLPLSLSSPAVIKEILTTTNQHLSVGTDAATRPPGTNISFLLSDAIGRTALSQWHIIQPATETTCPATLESVIGTSFRTFFVSAFFLILGACIIGGLTAAYRALHVVHGRLQASAAARRNEVPMESRGAEGEEREWTEEESGHAGGEEEVLLPPPYKLGDEDDVEAGRR
ncbi:hypothetical protein RQP46_010938 [Phenoliferia psychrophenolica]